MGAFPAPLRVISGEQLFLRGSFALSPRVFPTLAAAEKYHIPPVEKMLQPHLITHKILWRG